MNKIIILIIIMVFFVLVYLNLNKLLNLSELFSGSCNNKLTLINKDKSAKVIYTINTFNKYNKFDKILRNIGDKDNITYHYISNLDDWTNYESKIMKWLTDGLLEAILPKYIPLFCNTYIAKYKDGIEVDFPHTNMNTIFVTGRFINLITKYYNNNDLYGCISDVGSVITHELVHIWQRRDVDFFNKLYENWGFKYYPKIYNTTNLEDTNRYNPDGVTLNWVFTCPKSKDLILPMAIYKDDASNISNVNLVGIKLEMIGSTPIVPPIIDINKLSDIDEYNNFFGNLSGNNYHPNELSAEIISIILTNKILDKLSEKDITKYKTKTKSVSQSKAYKMVEKML